MSDIRIEMDVQLSLPQFYRALRWYSWRKYWWFYCLPIVGLAIFATVQFHSPEGSASLSASVFFGLVMAGFLSGLFYWSIYRNARKQFKSNAAFGVPRHYILSAAGVETSNSFSSGKFSWDVLNRILESPESFLLFTTNVVFFVLPKQALGGEDKTQSLRDLMRQQMGKKAQLRNR